MEYWQGYGGFFFGYTCVKFMKGEKSVGGVRGWCVKRGLKDWGDFFFSLSFLFFSFFSPRSFLTSCLLVKK